MRFEHINEKQGLSQNSVYSIVQDGQGFLWMGTDDGLNRFDGYSFEVFRPDDKNPKSILAGKIKYLHACNNNLVLLTENGISRLNTKTFESVNYSFSRLLTKPRLVYDNEKTLLVGADNGLFFLDTETGKYISTIIKDPITGFCKIKQGVILIGVSSGLYLYYPFNKKIIQLHYNPQLSIQDITCNEQGQLNWVEDGGTLYTGIIIKQNIVIKRKTEIAELSKCTGIRTYENNIIIGTPNGLIKIDSAGFKTSYTNNENEPYSLSGNRISCLYTDRNKNLWIGTIASGINKYNPLHYKFGGAGPLLSSKFKQLKDITAFAQTKSGLLIYASGMGHLGIYDLNSNELVQVCKSDQLINCIVPANMDSNLFLLGTSKGLYEFNAVEKTIKKIKTSNAVMPFESDINCIIKETEGIFWMAGLDGLFLFDTKLNKTLEYYSIGNTRLGSNNIRTLFKADDNKLYLGSSVGLYQLNIVTHNLKQVIPNQFRF